MVPVPLFGALPGAPELLVILLITVLLGIPVLIVVLAVVVGINLLDGSSDDRVEELEQELQETRAKVEELRAELDGPGNSDTDNGT